MFSKDPNRNDPQIHYYRIHLLNVCINLHIPRISREQTARIVEQRNGRRCATQVGGLNRENCALYNMNSQASKTRPKSGERKIKVIAVMAVIKAHRQEGGGAGRSLITRSRHEGRTRSVASTRFKLKFKRLLMLKITDTPHRVCVV